MLRVLAVLLALMSFPPSVLARQAFGAATRDQIVVPPTPGGLPVPPARDQAPKTGTARLRGRVTAADTGQPLRKALVRLTSPEIRESRSTATAGDGVYEFKDLPAGRYTVTASKGSYVQQSYGQTRPLEGGKPIALSESQTVDKIDLSLPRGGIIAGRVVDEFGEPVADAQVMPLRQQFLQGRRRLMPTGRSSTTNDIGEFRLFGLAPGDYFVSTMLHGGGAMMMERSDDRSGYAPTYYPGTSDLAAAQKLAVAVGQTITDIHLPLVPTQTAQVSGTVTDADGRPVTLGMVMMMPRGMFMPMNPAVGQILPTGTFTVSGVAPGEYTLRAMAPTTGGGTGESATATVSVNGHDVTGIRLLPPRLVTASGRVSVEGAASQSLTPGMVQLSFSAVDADEAMMPGSFSAPVAAKDDFSFEVKTVPGKMALRVNVMNQTWGLKSVRYRGADVTDSGIEISPGIEVTDLEVELTNRRSEVSGGVTNSKGERVSDYTVIVFPQDRDRWENMPRYFGTGRPDQDGRFRIRLPPAAYYAMALESVDRGEWMDPDFLDSVRQAAVGFSIAAGEAKTLDLRLSGRR